MTRAPLSGISLFDQVWQRDRKPKIQDIETCSMRKVIRGPESSRGSRTQFRKKAVVICNECHNTTSDIICSLANSTSARESRDIVYTLANGMRRLLLSKQEKRGNGSEDTMSGG